MQSFRSKTATVIEVLHEEDEEEDEDFLPHVTFSSNFLHAVIFLPVLHLDVL